jgi:hypothetical protein
LNVSIISQFLGDLYLWLYVVRHTTMRQQAKGTVKTAVSAATTVAALDWKYFGAPKDLKGSVVT